MQTIDATDTNATYQLIIGILSDLVREAAITQDEYMSDQTKGRF